MSDDNNNVVELVSNKTDDEDKATMGVFTVVLLNDGLLTVTGFFNYFPTCIIFSDKESNPVAFFPTDQVRSIVRKRDADAPVN